MKITTDNEKRTFAFAKRFARTLKGGEVIGLVGELGAGKTVFAKGLAAGLGVKQTVNSPTFVLMKVYRIKNHPVIKKLIHIDAYRINQTSEIESVGIMDYLYRPDSVVVIEWADKIKKILPKKTILIKFDCSKNNRKIIYKI